VIGIAKAYATRVGEGPFPSELFGAEGDHLRELGGEYGATTKRPRRCGWLDLVQLKRAVQLNGMNAVALTKMDVLDDFDKIGVCVAYRIGEREYTEMPVNPVDQAAAKPVIEFWPGWRAATSAARRFEDLPENARNYVQELERRLEVPITLVSAGRDRSQLIVREPAF
ncbi:MAG: adenylosuccinate synthetase, partial [Kiritimatiellia bacterium]